MLAALGSKHVIYQRSIIAVVFAAILVYFVSISSAAQSPQLLTLSHAEYLDRVQAIWMAQMIAQTTGVRFEHKPASTLHITLMTHLAGYAPVDDGYYYEMVA